MATARTKVDALGIYLSGASSDGAAHDIPDNCLGGYRSSIEARRAGFLVKSFKKHLRIDWVSGSNGTGDGSIAAQSSSAVKWTPSGGTIGASVTIANGETKLLEASTTAQAVRVTRVSADALNGSMTLGILPIFNDALGMDNVTSAEALAGLDTYRAVFLRNHSDASITSIAIWIKTLGTQRTTGTAQLGATGSGTITTATASGFADWPACGWAHIKNAGTTREIVYYTSRTSTSLTVPAAGRARLGTSAGAGAGTDTIDAVPGIRIGLEAPSSSAIQTIANDSTAPSGITWNAQTTSAAGLTIATLTTSSDYGLWVHREIPAGAFADANIQNAINIEFIYSGTTYDTVLSGRYRLANDALALYELYEGVDADPTYTSATSTSATLPFDRALAAPGSGNYEYRHVIRQRNKYNLVSQNRYIRKTKIDSSGAQQVVNPTAPTNVTLTDIGGGYAQIRANYLAQSDDPKADKWSIRVTGSGVDPTGSETAILVAMTPNYGIFTPGTPSPLSYNLGPYVAGQDVRVLLRTQAGSTESTNTTANQLTMTSAAAGAVLRRDAFIGAGFGQRIITTGIARTEYISVTNNIYVSYGIGYTELYAGGNLIWRIRYDSSGATNNGIWTTYSYQQEQQSGTATTTDAVDYSAWAGSSILYITVNDVWRMKIDAASSVIKITSWNQGVLTVGSSHSSTAIYDATFKTLFQVWDPNISDYATALDLDSDGTLRMNVPWRQRATTGAFE